MKLPSVAKAIVDRAKIVDYLLSPTHVVGRHKAAWFREAGYSDENWQELAGAIKEHARSHAITKEEPSPFGRRFVVEGIMQVPDGRRVLVRTVWFIRHQESTPRFVTAYPLKQRITREPK